MPVFQELSCRRAAKGGDIDADVAWLDGERLRGTEHLVLLLHGYNNNREDAGRSYQKFYDLQQGLVGTGSDWAPGVTVVPVYWPGDAGWGLLSPAYYPWAVPRAQQVADLLSTILIDVGNYSSGRLTVDFVAHSLGSRVLLRTLALLPNSNLIWVRSVVHMAAAVPTWKLDDPRDPDKLSDGFSRETSGDSRTLSLYSGHDRVLKFAFPLGETASPAHDGFFPTALGHESWPGGSGVGGLGQQEVRGANHGDYWGADSATPDVLRDFVSRAVQRELELSSSLLRDTPVVLPVAEAGTPDREAVPARTLDARTTTARTAGNAPPGGA